MNWRPVTGFETKFEVSDTGLIRSIKHSRVLKTQLALNGYEQVIVYAGGGRPPNRRVAKISIHHAVAEAFVPNPDNKPEVNHKDMVKTNNSVANLEWSTSSENKQHAMSNGVGYRGEQNGMSKFTEGQILEIRAKHADPNAPYGIGRKLAKEYDTTPQAISMIVNRVNWRHI